MLQESIAAAEVVEARLLPLEDALEVAPAGAVLARLAAARSKEDPGKLVHQCSLTSQIMSKDCMNRTFFN